jgi:carbonic anhydrase/acetyltransferase-like protein (isoleucine patch superfamily)
MQIQNPFNLPLPDSAFGGGLVMPYLDFIPQIGEHVFIAPNATVIGRVFLAEDASIWPGAVLRGDIADIRVGRGSNIQDNSVLHIGTERHCIVGDHVIVGHKAMLHACTVEDYCLIGMGSIVLDGAVIGEGSVVGAGALVTQNTIIPPHSMVLGSPAKVRRELTPAEREEFRNFAPKYVGVKNNYRDTIRRLSR